MFDGVFCSVLRGEICRRDLARVQRCINGFESGETKDIRSEAQAHVPEV